VRSTVPLRRKRWILAGGLLSTAALAAVPLPGAWKHWHYSRQIELVSTSATRLVSVTIPPDLYLHAQPGLGDIRVIDDPGTEVPYALFVREGSTNAVPVPTTIHENSFAPGLYTQVVLDAGEKAPFHNRVYIETSETDFIEWVHVEASDDAHVWRIVQERAPIFRFQREGREGKQTVNYSENNARYLRIQILRPEKQFPVNGASILYKTVDLPERAPFDAKFVADSSAPAGSAAWRIDLGAPAPSPAEIRFAVGLAEFVRNVEISASENGADWEDAARGEIYRFHRGDAIDEQLTVPISGDWQFRYWRVTILNGDDAALPVVAPALYITPRHIVFEQQPGRNYRLLFGQSEAKQPRYDLSRRINSKQEEAAIVGGFGPEEINPDYSDPRPWTEQHAVFLWVVLGVAMAALAYSALRSLRRSAPGSAPSG